MLRSFLFCLALAISATGSEPLSLSEFQTRLAGHLSQKRFAPAAWGIQIVSLESGRVLFETNALKLLKPASNAKIYTGALALDRFGPDYKIRTSIFAQRPPDSSGVLKADLIIYGRGDPSFSARFNDGNYSNLLGGIVAAIKRAGIRSIEGDLVGDETYFSGPRAGSGWAWDDLTYYYGAEASALSVQDNVIDLFLKPSKVGEPCILELKPESDYLRFVSRPTTGPSGVASQVNVYRGLGSTEVYLRGTVSPTNGTYVEAVTVPNPALWFVTLLRQALGREGINLRGKVRTIGWPDENSAKPEGLRELGFVESKPMRELIENMLKPSQNLYAQLLLLHAGAQSGGSNRFTEEQGIRALRDFLRKAEINPAEVLLEEGSGLSRSGLVTPNSAVQLLRFMAKHKHAAVFEESLPAPGEGTLRRRMLDLKGTLRAKTGTIHYVNTLSGYMKSRAGERFAFSIMLNAYDSKSDAAPARDEIDFVPRLLARLGDKTSME